MHGVGCWRDEWVGGWVGGRSGRTCIRRDPKSADRWVERVDLFFSFHGYTISVSLLVLTLVFHVCFIFRSVGLFVFWGLVSMFVFMFVTFWVSSPLLFLFYFHFIVLVSFSFPSCGKLVCCVWRFFLFYHILWAHISTVRKFEGHRFQRQLFQPRGGLSLSQRPATRQNVLLQQSLMQIGSHS